MSETQGEAGPRHEVIEAATNLLNSGCKLIGAIGRIGPIRRIRPLIQVRDTAIFFEGALCTTKYLASELRCELGVAPARLNVRARARLGRAESGFDWRIGGAPKKQAAQS